MPFTGCTSQSRPAGGLDQLLRERAILQSAQAGGPLKGAAFWNFLADGQQAPAAEGGGGGLYGIKVEDSTFSYIRDNANLMSSCALCLPFETVLVGTYLVIHLQAC